MIEKSNGCFSKYVKVADHIKLGGQPSQISQATVQMTPQSNQYGIFELAQSYGSDNVTIPLGSILN